MRVWITGLTLVVVLAAAVPPVARAQEEGQVPTRVIVAPARHDRFVDSVEALGTTRANESVDVTASVTEKITELRFDDGEVVEEGRVLVVLERREETAALRSAEALLAERTSSYERAKQLESQQFTAKAQLEERRAAMQQAEAEVAAAQARFADREIRAPFDGVVGLRNVSVGRLVEPGDLIATLDDLSVMKLDFSVPSVYLPTLRPGLEISARAAAFGDRAFVGEVKSVDTRIDPVSRSVLARAVVPNPEGALRPGLLMTVMLLRNPRDAIVVPEESLVPRGQENHVFVVHPDDGNRVERRAVTVGARRPGEAEIIGGIEEGELVVTHGTIHLQDGDTVAITATETGDESLQELLGRGSGS